jgi:DNA-binding NarL/FixJ family response regulator
LGGTYFKPACFANPPYGEFGNAPGYLSGLRNLGIADEDLGLSKSIPFAGERCQLHVCHQAFNAGKKPISNEIATHLAEHFSDDALCDREVEVLHRIAEGNRNRDNAEKLFIGEETVKVHIKHIMEKLGANDRTPAVAIAVRRGIINL